MELTPRAQKLHEAVTPGLIALGEAIEGPEVFESAKADQTMTMGMSDSPALLILPPLLKRLEQKAPGLRIICDQCGPAEAMRRVRDGRLDLAVGYFATSPIAGLVGRDLSSVQAHFAVVDRGNPWLENGTLSREKYLELPHIAVTLSGGSGPIDTAIETLGLKRNVRIVAPSFSVVPALVRGTNMVGHCSRRLVEQSAFRDTLLMFEPPVPLAVNYLRAVWRRSAIPDPAVGWLVDEIALVVKDADAAPLS